MDNNGSLRGILYCTVYIYSYITERTGRPLYLPIGFIQETCILYSVSVLEYSFYLTSTEMKRDYQVQSERSIAAHCCIYNINRILFFLFLRDVPSLGGFIFKLRLIIDVYKISFYFLHKV
jgi:hypothetical protein